MDKNLKELCNKIPPVILPFDLQYFNVEMTNKNELEEERLIKGLEQTLIVVSEVKRD